MPTPMPTTRRSRPTMNAAERDAVALRHAILLEHASQRSWRPLIIALTVVAYCLFSWWMFNVGDTLRRANWGIAGTYLADWVSYEVRPEFDIARDGAMTLAYPRFSPLGDHPNPDWLTVEKTTMTRTVAAPVSGGGASTTAKPSMGFMGAGASLGEKAAAAGAAPKTVMDEVVTRAEVRYNGSTRIEITPDIVTADHAGETLTMRLNHETGAVEAEGALPEWATQKRPGEKITLAFGPTGWAEVAGNDVSIRNRFFGWANFLFDTQSPFFDKSASEVFALITSAPRIDPAQSNLSLAWNNILYNSEWQHLDVWTKLLQTIVMAFIGTLFASLVAFPLCFVAARNITGSRIANQATKRFFDFLRSVDMLIWALFFTRAFGPGPLAGMSAIFFTDTGTLGKLYSEALENIDDKQREGVKSVGAPEITVKRFGILPQVLPVFASQALYFWESNTRSATIIGAVGAGGIGLKLWEAMRTNSDWENVAYMVVLILGVVFLFDTVSNALRSRLIGSRGH
ncbi:phosphonate ABC transporter, permease protein PhnE [Rhizobium sp. SG2393]|uniref:phosphonate ABC transporter, permease protein PhnE n=1 Tax=Rhizobium sp. SG2393 TaxID=3276279 RepID=UPI003671E04A